MPVVTALEQRRELLDETPSLIAYAGSHVEFIAKSPRDYVAVIGITFGQRGTLHAHPAFELLVAVALGILGQRYADHEIDPVARSRSNGPRNSGRIARICTESIGPAPCRLADSGPSGSIIGSRSAANALDKHFGPVNGQDISDVG